MAAKRVKVHYRKLVREPGLFPDASLSDRITAALNARLADGSLIGARPEHRVAEVAGAADYRRVLLHKDVSADFVFGTTCLFAPGQQQAFLRLAAAEEHGDLERVLAEWEIREQAAPRGSEFLHGLTYWLAIGDHFYQIQHINLQAKAMEEYFTWLLRDRARVIGGGQAVVLQSFFDRQMVGDDLSSIEVGGLVPETVVAPPERPPLVAQPGEGIDVVQRETVGERAAATFDKGLRILRELLGEVETDRIIEQMPPEAALDVKVNIGFRSKKRKLPKEVMRNLETGLRHLPDGEIRAKDKYGTVLGDDARLSLDMSVNKISETSSLLVLEHAKTQMLEVHRRFIHDGKNCTRTSIERLCGSRGHRLRSLVPPLCWALA